VQRSLHRQEVQDFIQKLDDPVFNLLIQWDWPSCCCCCRPTGMSKFFRTIDTDGSGFISEEEWSEHMYSKEEFLLNFEFRAQLLSRRRFWAMGPEDDDAVRCDEQSRRYPMPGFFESFCRLRENFRLYRNDFLFNAGNNHPLLCLWYSHDDNLLTRFEHFLVEAFAISMTALTRYMIHAMLAEDGLDDPSQADSGTNAGLTLILAQASPKLSWGSKAVLDFLIGQFLIASPSMLFSSIAGLLLGWPIIPKRALHAHRILYTVRLGRFCFKVLLIGSLLIFPVSLTAIADEGNLVRWTVFRMVAYLEWFPLHVLREYTPIQLTCIGRCLGKWWKERGNVARVKPKVVTSCSIVCQIIASIGWLFLSFFIGLILLVLRMPPTQPRTEQAAMLLSW